MKASILIVEDDILIAEAISEDLEKENYKVLGRCDSGSTALKLIDANVPDLVLMDIRLKGDMTGLN